MYFNNISLKYFVACLSPKTKTHPVILSEINISHCLNLTEYLLPMSHRILTKFKCIYSINPDSSICRVSILIQGK